MPFGYSGLRATLRFIRNPERFIKDATNRWGATFHFPLAGRKILATGDPVLASELFGANSEGMFFPEPIFEVLGVRSIIFQRNEEHTRLRSLLRTSLAGVALQPIARYEARLLAQEVLEPLRGSFRVNLMPALRRYMFHATLQMLTGQAVRNKALKALWDTWIRSLHPLLLLPPHPWVRFSFWGRSPWDRCVAARNQLRAGLCELAERSTPGYPAHRLMTELEPEVLVDQLLTVLFASQDNPAIILARMLAASQQDPQLTVMALMDQVLEKHPPMPLIPHAIREARPDLGLVAGDGVALLPGVLQNRSAFGFGPHRCLGVQWTQVLLEEAMRMLWPHLQGHRLEVGPSIRQRFSWGPDEIWLSP